MIRLLVPMVLCVLVGVLAPSVRADDPPKKLTAEERKELEAKWGELNEAGLKAYQAGKYADAIQSFEENVKVARRLYNAADFPDGHPNLAKSLDNLGGLYQAQGKFGAAESLCNDALEMRRRLYKGRDHAIIATSLNRLATLYQEQGKVDAAAPLCKDALEMYKRLYKGQDHPEIARSMNNLAVMYENQDKRDAAEVLFTDSLEMYKRLYKGQDHPEIANRLADLGALYRSQGKYAAAEPLCKDALEMYRRLFKGQDHLVLARNLNSVAMLYQGQGNYAAAEPLCKDSLAMYERLFKGQDHNATASGMSVLASLYLDQGNYAAAEPLCKDALEMRRRLQKGQDHDVLVRSMDRLAGLYKAQGKYAAAEPLFTDALDMSRRLHKGQDHLTLAHSLIQLAEFYHVQGNSAAAEPLCTDAVDMFKRLHKGQYHEDVAAALTNLAFIYEARGKNAAAEPLCQDALEMRRRLHKGQDHPAIAAGLNNLAVMYKAHGKYAAAEPLLTDALEMRRRLYKGEDHDALAAILSNLASLHEAQGKPGKAVPLYKDALRMYRRLAVGFAEYKTEGETLTLVAKQPFARDSYLSVAQDHGADAAGVYAELWSDKGYVARAYERRLLQTRAATDPAAVHALADLNDARRRRAELLLAPATADAATLAKRKADLESYEGRIEAQTRALKALLPAAVRADRLDAAASADLQKALPADAAVVDFIWFLHFAYDKNKPGKTGEVWTPRYLAFVLTKGKVSWVDLGTAAAIEPAVDAWRAALTSGKADEPAAAKVRELIWAKVRTELAAGTATVYVCPDAALCRVPFAALPGDKPGTVVLEEFAVATIPHAPFLLDKLSAQNERKNPPASALVVGAVKYAADLAPPAPNAVASRGEPLVKPGQKLGWAFLPNTAGEANGIAAAAERKKISAVRLDGEKATTAAVLAALPKAKYAHLATHGFFADPSFRSPFQLDEKDFETRGGERVGKAALSPLVMTGLVFAGANDPSRPGRGIVTGEQLIDLDLSGLELAVLSACETGLGDVAGGQGTFGLQRAFHYAGTTNVVCSLWKVPDESTAALMGLFYANLWDQGLSPVEALRRAQLAVYRNPGKVAEWANGFRGKFDEVPGAAAPAVKPDAGGKAHPLFWAAFTLSGPGR